VNLVCWLRIGVSDGEAVDVVENVYVPYFRIRLANV
jgi:hypothetical protein